MTRTEQLKSAVAEAYKNACDGGYFETVAFSDEDLAGDMIAYDDDISGMVEGDPDDGIGGVLEFDKLVEEVAALLPEVRREYAERQRSAHP